MTASDGLVLRDVRVFDGHAVVPGRRDVVVRGSTRPLPDPAAQAKYGIVTAGTDRAYELARRHEVKVAWGSDILFDAAVAARQGRLLTKMTRWFTPLEVLTMATSTNAELLAASGERNPYGRLGVVEPGALADLLLVDGDPSVDLDVLADPDRNLVAIIKDGVVHHDATA